MTICPQDDFDYEHMLMVVVEVIVDDFPPDVVFKNKIEQETQIMENAAREIAESQMEITFISARFLKPTFQIMKQDPNNPDMLSVFGKVEVYYVPKKGA